VGVIRLLIGHLHNRAVGRLLEVEDESQSFEYGLGEVHVTLEKQRERMIPLLGIRERQDETEVGEVIGHDVLS
jgi:hypothetical protein